MRLIATLVLAVSLVAVSAPADARHVKREVTTCPRVTATTHGQVCFTR